MKQQTDPGKLRDLMQMGKPRITLLVLLTSAVGMFMAPGSMGWQQATIFLVATSLLVASANTLNCWIERDSDGLMKRTMARPLPAGRISARLAFTAGVVEGLVALVALAWVTNLATFLLGLTALVSYVAVYTPLKRVSWWAVVIGAIPGAIPPLMGWTSITGSLDAGGWLLFGILFMWQLPHFIAISLYLKEDYRRGGLQVLPVAHGDEAARRHLFAYTVLLVAVSLLAPPMGMAGLIYGISAAILGAGFLYFAAHGLRRSVRGAWARRTFAYSLVYLSALIVMLMVDAR